MFREVTLQPATTSNTFMSPYQVKMADGRDGSTSDICQGLSHVSLEESIASVKLIESLLADSSIERIVLLLFNVYLNLFGFLLTPYSKQELSGTSEYRLSDDDMDSIFLVRDRSRVSSRPNGTTVSVSYGGTSFAVRTFPHVKFLGIQGKCCCIVSLQHYRHSRGTHRNSADQPLNSAKTMEILIAAFPCLTELKLIGFLILLLILFLNLCYCQDALRHCTTGPGL